MEKEIVLTKNIIGHHMYSGFQQVISVQVYTNTNEII